MRTDEIVLLEVNIAWEFWSEACSVTYKYPEDHPIMKREIENGIKFIEKIYPGVAQLELFDYSLSGGGQMPEDYNHPKWGRMAALLRFFIPTRDQNKRD